VALDAIGRSFAGSSEALVSWVLSAYAIIFAAVLVPAGRLADQYGRKRVLLGGVGRLHGRVRRRAGPGRADRSPRRAGGRRRDDRPPHWACCTPASGSASTRSLWASGPGWPGSPPLRDPRWDRWRPRRRAPGRPHRNKRRHGGLQACLGSAGRYRRGRGRLAGPLNRCWCGAAEGTTIKGPIVRSARWRLWRCGSRTHASSPSWSSRHASRERRCVDMPGCDSAARSPAAMRST
jgi:hypothetical protein